MPKPAYEIPIKKIARGKSFRKPKPESREKQIGHLGLPPEIDLSNIINPDRVHLNWAYSQSSRKGKIEFAARWGAISYLKRLYAEKPFDVNLTDAINDAALCGHFDMVRCLVEEYNADVNKLSRVLKDSPLHNAIGFGSYEIVHYLLSKGANIHVEGGFFNETPIQLCQREIKGSLGRPNLKCLPIMRLLIENGANISAPHLLFGISPHDYLQNLITVKPKLKEKIEKLLNDKVVSIDELTSLMEEVNIGGSNRFANLNEFALALSQISISASPPSSLTASSSSSPSPFARF